jgi:integrase
MARQRGANGEGGVSRRKDGSWMARYTVQTPSGRKRKVIYAKSQAEARRKLTEALADRDRGLTYDAEGLTLEGYLARWLEDSVRGSVKVTTYQSYGSLVRLHVCPTLGSTKLSVLTPAHVQGLYRQKLDDGLAPKTVKYIHTTLHRALKQAVRWGLVPRNAAAEADPPRVVTPEMRPLSRASPHPTPGGPGQQAGGALHPRRHDRHEAGRAPRARVGRLGSPSGGRASEEDPDSRQGRPAPH